MGVGVVEDVDHFIVSSVFMSLVRIALLSYSYKRKM